MRARSALFALGLLSSLALATPREARALDGARLPTQHMHDAWSDDVGLPQNSVKAIVQTPHDGFLWIGTEEGLVRFDGRTFRTFDKATTTGRTTNIVSALAIDKYGALVLLGGKDGICTFDEPRFTCTALPDGAEGTTLVPAGQKLLVTTSRGLFVRDDHGLTRDALFGDQPITTAVYGPNDRILALTRDRGVVRAENGVAKAIELSLAPTELLGIFRLKDGTTWLGSSKGPFILDGEKLVVPSFAGRPEKPVRFIADDRDGNVWVSAFDDGLFRTRGVGFAKVPLGATQPAERLDAFFEDDEKNVWIGSRLSGLHRLRDGALVPWGIPEGIAHGFVSAVLAGHGEDILIGTGNGGLFLLRGDRIVRLGKKDGLPTDQIVSLAKGLNGTYLVGTRAGLARVTMSEPAPKVELVPYMKDEHITAIVENERGLIVGSTTELVVDGTPVISGLGAVYVSVLLPSKDGSIWVGMLPGLYRLRGQNIETPFPLLARMNIASLAEREDGSLLVGSTDGGLVVPAKDDLRVIDHTRGLFDDTVHSLIDDGAGRLWISCNKGISFIRAADVAKQRVEATVFGRESGMRSRECNGGSPSAMRDARGRIWFATMLGAAVVDPASLPVLPPPRAPIIDSARVAGRTIPHPTLVSLPIDARSLEIVFAAPSLTDPERTTFEMRLGDAGPWTTTAGRSASFPAFGPGSHKVEVRTRHPDGKTSDAAVLYVDVPPRIVERTIFRVGSAILVAGLVLAFGVLRLRASERDKKRLEAIVADRTRELAEQNDALSLALENLKKAETDLVRAERMASVATLVRGIAHELNNPLSFVTGNVGSLRRYADFLRTSIRDVAGGTKKLDELRLSPKKDLGFVERDLDKLLADMEEGGRRAKLIVGDLQSLTSGQDARALVPIDLTKVVAQSVRLLEPAKPESVTITIDCEETEPLTARAGEIEQAIVNLIDNALKAVDKRGVITVRVRHDGEDHLVTVEDDGPGMPEEVRARATEPFFTTRGAGEGSGLGLAIVQRIAEHHGGSLTLESAPGKGTRAILRIREVQKLT